MYLNPRTIFLGAPPQILLLPVQNRIQLRLQAEVSAADKISKAVEIDERYDAEERPAQNRAAFVLRKVGVRRRLPQCRRSAAELTKSNLFLVSVALFPPVIYRKLWYPHKLTHKISNNHRICPAASRNDQIR
jgi:hypothetical protein